MGPPLRDLRVSMLIEGGFARAGSWSLDPAMGELKARFDGTAPREPGVYAHVVNGIAKYVGSAQGGLRRRLGHYQRTMRLRTAFRVRTEIVAALEVGSTVETFMIVPPPDALTWSGFPIDPVAGLEEGLIRAFRPEWNRRGLGRRELVELVVGASDER